MSENTKKLSAFEVTTMIQEMVSEELRKAREDSRPIREGVNLATLDKDDLNPVFTSMRPADQKAMIQWIMRYFFTPAKKNQPWWSNKITPANVLAFISQPRSGFPLTPREMVDDWKIKKSLKTDLAKISDADVESFSAEPTGPVNNTGEKSLKDIAAELGGLSLPSISQTELAGLEKLKKLLGGKNPMSMDADELENLLKHVKVARETTSHTFAQDLKAAGGDVKKFFKGLVAKGIMQPVDISLLKPREIEMLVFLMDKPEDQIAQYLRGDALKADNKIKTFQAAVARSLSPVRPRGRPRKNPV